MNMIYSRLVINNPYGSFQNAVAFLSINRLSYLIDFRLCLMNLFHLESYLELDLLLPCIQYFPKLYVWHPYQLLKKKRKKIEHACHFSRFEYSLVSFSDKHHKRLQTALFVERQYFSVCQCGFIEIECTHTNHEQCHNYWRKQPSTLRWCGNNIYRELHNVKTYFGDRFP